MDGDEHELAREWGVQRQKQLERLLEGPHNAGSTVRSYAFEYDSLGRLIRSRYTQASGKYSETRYYYVLNLQGDVVALMTGSGTVWARYTYDAWGKQLQVLNGENKPLGSTSDYFANANPFRYRGYYCDVETGFYYLQSRYYDPNIGRFINADAAEYSEMAAYGLNDTNLFVYCRNNPVSYADKDGEWINVVIGAVVGGVISAAITAYTSYKETGEVDVAATLVSATMGAIAGGFAATGLGGVVGQMAVGAATSFVDSGFSNYRSYSRGNISAGEAIVSTMASTACGTLFGAFGAFGTAEFKNSTKITSSGLRGLRTLISEATLHPAVKTTAKTAVKTLAKYTGQTAVQSIGSSLFSAGVSWGTSTYSRLSWKRCIV